MQKYLLVVALLLQGCSVSLGLALHPEAADNPEIALENPLGVVRLETKYIECQHISGLTKREQGYGLTMCGPPLYQFQFK